MADLNPDKVFYFMENCTYGLLMEQWKEVKGYEGIYEVSDFGRVKSLSRIKSIGKGFFVSNEHVLKLKIERNGYVRVMLQRDAIRITYLVHRLVAEAFIPNPENHPEVNHFNKIRGDNVKSNLEWVTTCENRTHSKKTNAKLSPFVGVYFDNRNKSWDSKISVAGKIHFLGSFKNQKDAIDARKNAMVKYGILNKYAT